jgi:alkane 1-monooxygenase
LAYTVPLSAYISYESFGLGTYTAVFYAFVILPILDLITGKTPKNLNPEKIQQKSTNKIFDWMLYLNLPIVFFLLYVVFFKNINHRFTLPQEYIGLSISNRDFISNQWHQCRAPSWVIEKA